MVCIQKLFFLTYICMIIPLTSAVANEIQNQVGPHQHGKSTYIVCNLQNHVLKKFIIICSSFTDKENYNLTVNIVNQCGWGKIGKAHFVINNKSKQANKKFTIKSRDIQIVSGS